MSNNVKIETNHKANLLANFGREVHQNKCFFILKTLDQIFLFAFREFSTKKRTTREEISLPNRKRRRPKNNWLKRKDRECCELNDIQNMFGKCLIRIC